MDSKPVTRSKQGGGTKRKSFSPPARRSLDGEGLVGNGRFALQPRAYASIAFSEGWLNRRRQPVKQTTAAFNEKTKEEEELRLGKKGKSEQRKQMQLQQARYARLQARNRAFSEWSIQPTQHWQVLAELPLQLLHKQQVESGERLCTLHLESLSRRVSFEGGKALVVKSSKSTAARLSLCVCVSSGKVSVKDLCWRGSLGYYCKQADKITPKAPAAMQNISSKFDYYWVTTQDDEVIRVRGSRHI